jgi:hypothetical protein
MTDTATTTTANASEAVPLSARAASAIYVLLGLGFGVGSVVTLALFARDGELPMTPWGFRSLEGPFSQIGDTETLVLGAGLVAVCAADVVAGTGLWRGRRWAGRLGAATTPFALVFGGGFALPFLLLGIPIRVALLAASWSRLR